MKRVLWLVSVLTVLVLVGCSGGGNSSTYTLSGSVATPDGATGIDGKYAYLKLVQNGGSASSPALYWTKSTPFSGGSATYSVSGIAAGTYTGWAFINMNDSAPSDSSAMPDAGDYATPDGEQISISGDRTLNLDSSAMQQVVD